MPRFVLLLECIFASFFCNAQNLIRNGSFEDFRLYCPSPPQAIVINPDTLLDRQIMPYWNDGFLHDENSTGYWSCGAIITKDCGYISNPVFGYPTPLHGNSYTQVILADKTGDEMLSDIRCYLQTTFFSPLVQGKNYKISFWARLPNKSAYDKFGNIIGSNSLAAYISVGRPVNSTDSLRGFIKALPQIKMPSDEFLEDTTKWTQVCGYYSALGGERWLTIGNFYEKAKTQFKNIIYDPSNPKIDTSIIFCFVDVVSVELAEEIIPEEKKEQYICDTINGQVVLEAKQGYKSYLWNTGDTTRNINATKAGKYWVRIQNECGFLVDTIILKYTPNRSLELGNDIVACANKIPLLLSADSDFTSYEWNTGETTKQINVAKSGVYWLKSKYECGWTSDTIMVTIKELSMPPISKQFEFCKNDNISTLEIEVKEPLWYRSIEDTVGIKNFPIINSSVMGNREIYVTQNINGCESDKVKLDISIVDFPKVTSIEDTTICIGDSLSIFVDSKNSIMWNDDYIGNKRNIYKDGNYEFTDKNVCGMVSTSFSVKLKKCLNCIEFPNSFTPNNDGINDYFTPITSCEICNYELSIYNRWGNIVFDSSNSIDRWDGTFNGFPQNIDLYMFVCKFNDNCNKENTIVGKISLIR